MERDAPWTAWIRMIQLHEEARSEAVREAPLRVFRYAPAAPCYLTGYEKEATLIRITHGLADVEASREATHDIHICRNAPSISRAKEGASRSREPSIVSRRFVR